MSGEVIFYCPCNGTKHYFNETFIGQVSLYQLGNGARRTIANGVNGSYLKMPSNAFDFLFENFLPTTLTIEWWQRNVGSYGCIIMPSAQSDSKKLQTQVSTNNEKFTNIHFENRNGDLDIQLDDISNNQWTHVAYTQDYTNSRVYAHINGVFQDSASTNLNEYAWNLFCIGAKSSDVNSASEFFNGDIDEVIITNGVKYPFEQDFIPSTEAPSLTGLSQGGQEEPPEEQYEYISNITLSGTNRLIKTKVVEETNKLSNIKEWVGTRQEYDSILLKDNYTKYIITDDGGEGFSVDNALSTTSANPVENRVITNAIQNMAVAKTRIVGEIIESTIPLTNAGLHLLDGALISGSGSYSAFVTYIAGLVSSYPDLFTSESDWQQAVADYDVCGKFVYDSTNNTVRLPKLLGASRYLIKSEVNGTEWYRIYSDGWCEQGGYLGDTPFNTTKTISLPVPYNDTDFTILTSVKNSSGAHNFRFTKDSSSSITFNRVGDSNCTGHWMTLGYTDISSYKVEPLYQYIVIANSTKTEIEVDIDEIATDLNGKADVDLTNCTKPHIVETYSNGTSWYRVYSDGWCEQGGRFESADTSETQVNFLKEFADTNYTLVGLTSGNQGLDQYVNGWKVITLNTSSAVIRNNTNGTNSFMWRACGYIS